MCIDILLPNILVSKTPAILRTQYLPFPPLPRTRVRKKRASNFIGKYLHHIVHTSENSHTQKKFISFIRKAFTDFMQVLAARNKKGSCLYIKGNGGAVLSGETLVGL